MWSKNKQQNLPQHVAIILDGNGRWAQLQGKTRALGHQAGAQNIRRIVQAAKEMGIKTLTLYAFSTENWKRNALEVKLLMSLFAKYLREYAEELRKENIRSYIVGDKSKLSAALQKDIEYFEQETAAGTAMVLNVAINYGGRDEILKAVRQILADGRKESDVDEKEFSKYLYPSAAQDVDLLIRTGGDYRISNFLLWQISYAELYFTPVLWPDFSPHDLVEAVRSFQNRERRYGGIINEG